MSARRRPARRSGALRASAKILSAPAEGRSLEDIEVEVPVGSGWRRRRGSRWSRGNMGHYDALVVPNLEQRNTASVLGLVVVGTPIRLVEVEERWPARLY